MLKLYGFSKVNAVARGNTRDLRILWALEEMQMPFELVGLDHPNKELSTAAYHKLNPLEQIPVIDDDGVVLSESGAIVIYLAKKAGKLIPRDPAGEAQVLRWSFAALNSLEIPMMTLQFMDFIGSRESQAVTRNFMTHWATRHLTNLEGWFEGRDFIATDSFTVADILMAHVLTEIKEEEFWKPFPRVLAYRERCFDRPAWRRTIDRYFERVKPG